MKAAKSNSVISKKPKKRNAKKYTFPVIIEKDEGGYFAACPSLQGCYTQGDTFEETLANIEDAIRLHVEDRLECGEEIPPYEVVSFTTVEVEV